jgi:hypothetical protein
MMIFNAVEKLHYSHCQQIGPNMVLCETEMKTGMQEHNSYVFKYIKYFKRL